MDWVKLGSGYFLDVAVACLDDAGEVMFTRGLAYAGQAESGGFIPAPLLPTLGRRNQQRTAELVVAAGLWADADGGFQIVRWHEWQAELEVQLARRRREADRKRRARASAKPSADASPPPSADASADSGPTESREEIEPRTVVRGRAAHPRATPRTRIDDDWHPSPGAWAWSVENFPTLDLERELAQFRDHHAGKGSVMAQWDAAWRTWMRNAETYGPTRSAGRRAPTDLSGAMTRARAAEAIA